MIKFTTNVNPSYVQFIFSFEIVCMLAAYAHLLKAHLQSHPEYTGEGGAKDTWNTSDLLHLNSAPGVLAIESQLHLTSSPQLELELQWFTSITGACWTDEKQKFHTPYFTGPRGLFLELEQFCRQNKSSSVSMFKIVGWKRPYKFASNLK